MKKVFQKIGTILCIFAIVAMGPVVNAATIHNYEDWQTAGGNYGTVTKETPDGTVLKMTGSDKAGFAGQISGPYSKASKAKLSDTIVEELYLDVDLDKFGSGEFFEATVSLNKDANSQEELTERVIMVQEEGGKLRVTNGNYPTQPGWAPNFKAYIEEDGLYTLRWTYKIKDGNAYANFTLLHGDTVIGTTGDLVMNEITVSSMPDVQVRSVWINNIQVKNGVILHTKLPDVNVIPEVTGNDVTIDSGALSTLKNSLGNLDPEMQELIEKNETTITLEKKDITPTKNTVEAFASAINGATIANYFDLSILVKAAERQANLTQLNQEITLAVKLPELPKVKDGYNRKYYILREHDGVVEKLDANLSDDGNSLTFSSDKFSTYAIAYIDTATSSIKNPDTSDNIIMFIGIAFIGLCGLGLTIRSMKTKKM